MSLIFTFLMVLYKEQNMRVRWNSTYSELFSVSNGVKQGGVPSPILFSPHLDKLLVELRELGIGCHMNGLFTGAFIYLFILLKFIHIMINYFSDLVGINPINNYMIGFYQ